MALLSAPAMGPVVTALFTVPAKLKTGVESAPPFPAPVPPAPPVALAPEAPLSMVISVP